MKFWNRLTRRWSHATVEGQLRLTEAYRAVFHHGSDDQSQRQLVLADLQARTGWHQITMPDTADQRIWFAEGKRAAYAEIFGHLSLSPADVDALDNAARHEAVAINQDQQGNYT
jgi:hypothetical protein